MILITGASSGIGQFLFNHYKDKDKVYGTFYAANTDTDNLSKVDIRDFNEVERWKNSLPLLKDSKITLFNCAGISYNSFAHKADINSWQNVIDTNLIGTFNVIRNFLPHMRESNFGRIVNFSSIVAQIGVPGTSAYAASKSALWGLSKSLAVENASKGITINNINLGYCDVGMGLTQISAPQRTELLTKIPARRFGSADEILQTVNFFINTEYINGSSVDLNGALF